MDSYLDGTVCACNLLFAGYVCFRTADRVDKSIFRLVICVDNNKSKWYNIIW